ncbi:MAG: tRNA methyl transferase PRC-barrel domain-containing protein, partial [Pseudomonadota bacterium]
DGKYADVISKLRPNAALAGDIVHMDGRVLGQHGGILHYTIGQRRGLNVSVGEPLYVVKIDARTRRVIVGPREALDTHFVALREFNWLGEGSEADIDAPVDVLARVRSTRPPTPSRLMRKDGVITVELIGGEEGVSPGQACVLYDGEGAGARVLGGGFIDATERTPDVEAQLDALNEAVAA